jgi:hypothetical protein
VRSAHRSTLAGRALGDRLSDKSIGGRGRARGPRAALLFDTGRQMGNATVPPMFFFRDIDGNRFLIVEAG